MTSLNHDFNISSSCLAANNHALPQNLPNPVHFLAIRRVYFHSNAANQPGSNPPCLILMWVQVHGVRLRVLAELVLRMREAFRRWKFPALCLAECRFPPLENAFRRVYDNCEITSKTRNAMVKVKNNTGKCFQ